MPFLVTLFCCSALLALLPASATPASGIGRVPGPAPSGATEDASWLPGAIHSREIVEFSLSFPYQMSASVQSRDGAFISVNDGIPRGLYTMKLEKRDKGAFFSLSCTGGGEGLLHAEGTCPDSVLSELQALLEENGTLELNGYARRNSALGCGFSLKIRYASGETLTAQAEGGAAVMPRHGLPQAAFVAFFRKLARANGLDFATVPPCTGGIVSFDVEFLYEISPVAGVTVDFPKGRYHLALRRFANGIKAYAAYKNSGTDGGKQVWRTLLAWTAVQEPALAELQRLLDAHDVQRLNGYVNSCGPYAATDALFRLEIRCASGGKILAAADGPTSVLPVRDLWDERWFLHFFRELAARNGLHFVPGK